MYVYTNIQIYYIKAKSGSWITIYHGDGGVSTAFPIIYYNL